MKKTLSSIVVFFTLSLLLVVKAFALSKADVKGILKKFVSPEAKIAVLSLKEAPVRGLWEVVVEIQGKKNIVYIDSQKRYMILGSIVDVRTRENLTKQKLEDLNRVDFSQIPLDDAIVYGNAESKKRVVVFFDPD